MLYIIPSYFLIYSNGHLLGSLIPHLTHFYDPNNLCSSIHSFIFDIYNLFSVIVSYASSNSFYNSYSSSLSISLSESYRESFILFIEIIALCISSSRFFISQVSVGVSMGFYIAVSYACTIFSSYK
jgi:hypothetical protein